MKTLTLACAFMIACLPFSSKAQSITTKLGSEPCWDAAAKYHGLDPWLLYAVAYVESRHNPSVISKPNRNGTYDIGLMQINSIWLPELRGYGIAESTLKNACASTYVGAWVMAKNIRRYGYSWQAIAAYNVGSVENPKRRKIGYNYAKKVYEAHRKLSAHHFAKSPIANTPARSLPSVSSNAAPLNQHKFNQNSSQHNKLSSLAFTPATP